MSKSGQARVLTPEQQALLFDVIKQHRHAAKNTAIMQISFKLGLRVQEIALLQIKEVARLTRYKKNSIREFELLEILSLPASYTKGADAMGRSGTVYKRKRISFQVEVFDQIVHQIEALAKAGVEINSESFYPPPIVHKGKSRDLPMVDTELRESLIEYLHERLEIDPGAKPSDPLFLSQKGTPYSPNSLQSHMGMMLKDWTGVEKASSHSGRRTVITNIIHKQNKSVKIAQKIAGHVNPSTTIIYEEPPEESIAEALKNLNN